MIIYFIYWKHVVINTGPKLYIAQKTPIALYTPFAGQKWLPFAEVSNFATESFKWLVNRTIRRHRTPLSTINGVDVKKTCEGYTMLEYRQIIQRSSKPAKHPPQIWSLDNECPSVRKDSCVTPSESFRFPD